MVFLAHNAAPRSLESAPAAARAPAAHRGLKAARADAAADAGVASYQYLSGLAFVGQRVLSCVRHRLVEENKKGTRYIIIIITQPINCFLLTDWTMMDVAMHLQAFPRKRSLQLTNRWTVKMLPEESAFFTARTTRPKVAAPV